MLVAASPLMQRLFLTISLVVFGISSALSQGITEGKRKELRAHRIESSSFDLDGKLNDKVWRSATFTSDFLQKEPEQGAQPVEKTEVAVAYDESAVYIGARMYSANPDKLNMYLDRRDSQGPTEQFIVTFDTYLDRRTAYGFGVNTSGVRFDRYNSQDDEFDRDYSWDPVWEVRTARDEVSWTVEMRIPFSQLRFIEKENQVWGINFNRWVPDRNEDVFWIYIPRDQTGWSSHFGNLVGIEGIQPSRRIELLPYLAGDGSFVDEPTVGDPFNDGSSIGSRLGGDIKMGLGPNLTLDATINPDFGQVEADAAVVNLSAFETFFPEKRPFFTEGSQLFDPYGPSYFYSRRIGARPHASTSDDFAGKPANNSADFVGRPDNTTIIGAAKLTGRLGSGTSVGLLSAVTGREHADLRDTISNATNSFEIEPPTFFNIISANQEFGEDASTVGFVLTSLIRDIGDKPQFIDILSKRAFSGGANWRLRFNNGEYSIRGYSGFSHVKGSENKIADLQQNSAHYFQRPDASHVEFDPTRTSLNGYAGQLELRKDGGKHWRGQVGLSLESPEFEINDAGILGSADDIDGWTWTQYRETTPGKLFRNWNINLNTNTGWDFGGVRQYQNLNVNTNVTWNNYWSSWLGMTRQQRGQSSSRTRGGPVSSVESGFSWNGGFENNFSSATSWWVSGNYGIDELDGWLYSISGNLSTRLGTRWKLSVGPRYTKEEQPRQYVTALSADTAGVATTGGSQTFGTRYVFSRIARTTISMQIRANYFLTPDLSFELYAEPFVSNGRFFEHGELVAPFTHELLTYGEGGTTITPPDPDSDYIVNDGGETFTLPFRDFASLSFRSNMVIRYEFLPGSTLFLVWQRNLSSNLDDPSSNVDFGNIFNTLEGNGQDFFALKLSYWIPFK